MIYDLKLSGANLVTYNRIFQHPASHSVERHSIRTLFEKIAQVEDQSNGKFKVTRHGRTLVLPGTNNDSMIGTFELMTLRHFIENSQTASPISNGREAHWLLVIDHHEARIFRSEVNGGKPLEIRAYHPEVHFRHTHDSINFSRGKENLNESGFFAPVAEALKDAEQILIFGVGHGMSSAMEQFIAWLEIHHANISRRIVGAQVVDESHLTDSQLFVLGQNFFSTPIVPAA